MCLLELLHVLIIFLSQKVKQIFFIKIIVKINYGIFTILETSINIKLCTSHYYCQILSHCYIWHLPVGMLFCLKT